MNPLLRRRTVILLIAIAAALVQTKTGLPVQPPASSRAQADSLARKIQLIRARYEQESSGAMDVEVSEEEANAYIVHRLADQLPEGVTDPWVRFAEGPVFAGATLDLALLQNRMPQYSLLQLLSGRVPVELSARIHAEDGVGLLDLESVTVAGIPLPEAFIQELVTNYTKGPTRPGGVRIEEPFELPYGIESVHSEKGRILLRQGGGANDRNGGPPAMIS